MLQDTGAKEISQILYTALSRHFFREFTSKLQLEMNKEPVTGGMTTAGRTLGNQKSNAYAAYAQQQQQPPPQTMAVAQHQSMVRGGSTLQQQQPSVSTLAGQQNLTTFLPDDIDFARDQLPPRRNRQDDYIEKDVMGASNPDITAGGGGASTTNRRAAGASRRMDDEFSYTRKDSQQQNVIVQTILKKLEEMMQSKTVEAKKEKDATPTKKLVRSSTQATSMSNNQGKRIIEMTEAQGGKGSIRVGDIIIIDYDERVFDDDANTVGGMPIDIGHEDSLEMEKNKGQDNLKARITQKPDLEYKGIVFTDGVTNTSFTVMPRQLTTVGSAFTHFKKTLFRVEIAQECSANIVKQGLLEQLEDLERERSQYNEDRALIAKGGSQRRNNKEIQEIDRINALIEQTEFKLHENEKLLLDENKNNAYEFQINLGKKITYGQKIQFKHLFSDQYLTLNTKKISHENGCITLHLSPPNENSWFSIVPSEKIKCLGQSISYMDTFYIQNFVQNYKDTSLFYIHVNSVNLSKLGPEAVLEVNGSHEPSKFCARLFMDYNHLKYDKSNFESGDVLRLLHKEADGYLTIFERDVELTLPNFPDFLQRQVNKNEGIAGGPMKIMDGGNSGDPEFQEQAKAKIAQMKEIRRKRQNKVFIERDHSNLQFTNSCWEIQKVRTFHGGPILMNDVCRLRHVATGKYLAVSNLDMRELVLKESTDNSDSLFRLRRETFRPAHMKVDGDVAHSWDDAIDGDVVSSHDLVILETFNRSYLHLSESIKDNFSLVQADNITSNVGLSMKPNQAAKKSEVKEGKEGDPNNAQAQNAANKQDIDIHEDDNKIELVCGYFSKDDQSKMIFILEEVPPRKDDTVIAYQSLSFFKALHDFYEFLNMWAIIDVDEEQLDQIRFNAKQDEIIDQQKYDLQTARETDGELFQQTEDIEKSVIDQLLQIVTRAKEIGFDHYAGIQKHLAEQGILVMLIKILELIYYKCVTPESRDRDLIGTDIDKAIVENEDETPEKIAREQLDPLAEKILKLLYLLIKTNQENAEKLTKYDNIIYMMLTRYDAKLVSKIFKETYKRAKSIYGDTQGQQDSAAGAGGKVDMAAAIGSQLISSSGLGNVMSKWSERLDTIYYIKEGNENISKQILYLNVISMMCRDDQGNGLYNYQIQAIKHIIDNKFKIPITFGLSKMSIDSPLVFINKPLDESNEAFLLKNPFLRDVWKQHQNTASEGANAPVTSSICLDLYEVTAKNLQVNGRLQPYIDYIAAVINLYCHMCLSRNALAVKKLKEIGLTFDHVIAAVSQYGGNKKAKRNTDKIQPLNLKLISAYIMAARVMYTDTALFPSLSTYKNRCYYWETVHKADAHKTMYRWEKDKFFRGFEDNNRFLKEESDQHEEMAMGALRNAVYQFFSDTPDVLVAFLNSSESRRYAKRDVVAVLTLMTNFIESATSLISCELVDSKFVYRMLQAAALIFLSYHYKDMPRTEEKKGWIYQVLQVAKRTKRCREKIEVLEYRALKMLEIICKYRLNAQILVFLQLFRTFVEKNELPHVGQQTNLFDAQFQVIFQMYQFNIGKNLTFKSIQRMTKKAEMLFSSKQIKASVKPADRKRMDIVPIDDETDPNDQLLQIAEIKLTENQGPNQETHQDQIDDEGQVVRRQERNGEDGGEQDEGDDEEGGERNRRRKQMNDKYELDKFLLYLIFAKQTNVGIRNQAAKVLVQNFNQREALMNELAKIELIISEQDQNDYTEFMKMHFMLQGLIERLAQLGLEMKAAGGNGRARDIFSYTRAIEDITNILRGITTNLEQHVNMILISMGQDLVIETEQARLMKKQNMLRHMDISNDLIEKLMWNITNTDSFKEEMHGDMFKEISRFLFIYCIWSLSNQRTIVQHLNYLVSLTDLGVPTPKLIAQVLSQQRETEHGLRFLQFLTDKIAHQTNESFKSSLFKLLTLMMTRPVTAVTTNGGEAQRTAVNIEANQVFVLKRLVKKAKFRRSLFMDEKTNHIKLEVITELCKRIKEQKGFSQMTKADQIACVAREWEAMRLHVSVIDLLSACVRGCLFGRLQAQKLVTPEVLFDSILSEAVPFLLRRKYLRLLFETYIRALPGDTLRIDYNTQMFYDMMFYIVYEDLRLYSRFYVGLMAKPNEARRDNDTEAIRKRTKEALEQRSIEDLRKRNMERTRQEMENFRAARQNLSSLVAPQPIPLIDETDKSEYWKYLTQYKKSRNEADGLLHFIADFYQNVKRTQGKKMTKELAEITAKIREILMELSDDLHKIHEKFGEHLKNVEHILIVIDQALAQIPNVRTFKAGKSFTVKGGGAGGGVEVDIVDDHNDGDDEDNLLQKNDDEEEEEEGAAGNEEEAAKRKKARDEANELRNLDIQKASDKVIQIIRDEIVSDSTTIRELFKIKNFETNYIIKKLDMKKMIKEVVGTQATNEEIEMFMEFLDKHSREETEQRRTIQPDIATEGYIKTRSDPLKILQQNNGFITLINFRDLENLLKKALQKLQYKPPVQKRAREEMEEALNLEMAEDALSRACNTDLKLFTKCFFDFFQKFKSRDEIADIVRKIQLMFNEAFDSEDAFGNESNKNGVIKEFIENMIEGFHQGKDKIYLLRILNMIIDHYMPSNPQNKRQIFKAKLRLTKLQVIMKDCGLLTLLLEFISHDDIKITDEAIKLLCNLLCESNLEVQDYLLELMKHNRDNFKFFTFLKERLHKASEYLIVETEVKLVQRKLAEEADKYYRDPRIEALYNIYQQPFYLPSQSHDGQATFNLETEIKNLSSQQSSQELLNILRLIQLLCDNCHQGFQDYLRNQEENSYPEFQPLTTVNVVSEVATVLIKMTERLQHLIFSEYILYETVGQIFSTLIDFLHGPNIENQLLLGRWKKFSKAVNFYLNQNFGIYSANTTEQKAKLAIVKSCTDLLLALVESVDQKFRYSILKEMVPEISLSNLKNKMIDIFHYKVGGDSKRERIYYSNKKCKHYRDNTLIKRSNLCEKDEFCEFGNLIKFDKEVVLAGFNLFIFLFNFKEVDPLNQGLEDFDIEFKHEKIFQKMKKIYEKDVALQTARTPEKYRLAAEQNEIELEEAIQAKTEEILQQITVKDPTAKIFVELAKKHEDGGDALDISGELENKVFDMEEDKKETKKNKAKELKKKGKGGRKDKCCFCFPRRGKNQIVVANEESHGHAGEHTQLIDTFDLAESQIMLPNGAVSGQSVPVNSQLKEQTTFDRNTAHIQAREYLEAEAEEKYTIDQYKMDTAIRFYMSNVGNIEINYKGNLSKVMFRIPPFCTFFTSTSQRNMIYQANHESHIEKLEDFFNKKKIYRAEMKAIQKVARRSKILRWVTQQWRALSRITLVMVLIINLMFIIFYILDEDNETINLQFPQAEVTIEALGIMQAFLSFLVMVSYIMRYHGKIYEEYLEQHKLRNRDRFTTVKGSLGYAFGSEVYKLAHIAADQQKLQSTASLSKVDRDDELNLVKRRRGIRRKDIVYSVKIFLLSMKLDMQHCFHVVYFILSVFGVFYHTIFAFLLLDIVVKIPLLTSVVQAIVQNKKQLLYTFILLLVIVYIYSFIAFHILRSNYDSVDTDPDNPPDANLYCKTLLECFTSTLNNGLRAGGGIGDVLKQLSLYTDRSAYWQRYVFDMTFYFLVIILLMNLIFGIIIDAFANMRDEKNAIEADVKERCFICGLNRFEFETKNKSWFDHIYKEHNAFAYLYFILYVQHKPGNECTGVEKYVKSLVLKEDPQFFPVGQCLSIGFGTEPQQEKDNN